MMVDEEYDRRRQQLLHVVLVMLLSSSTIMAGISISSISGACFRRCDLRVLYSTSSIDYEICVYMGIENRFGV